MGRRYVKSCEPGTASKRYGIGSYRVGGILIDPFSLKDIRAVILRLSKRGRGVCLTQIHVFHFG